jgi:hypothetical protein
LLCVSAALFGDAGRIGLQSRQTNRTILNISTNAVTKRYQEATEATWGFSAVKRTACKPGQNYSVLE